jgi:hypothetical protein
VRNGVSCVDLFNNKNITRAKTKQEAHEPLTTEIPQTSPAEAKAPEADVTRYRVRVIAEGVGEAEGELIRFQSPMTVENLGKALPFEGRAAKWKEEIYFETPVKMGSEKPKAKVEIGTIAYWPMGSALCIFYGPTDPYSPVNVVGKIVSNLEMFRTVKSGTKIRVERI